MFRFWKRCLSRLCKMCIIFQLFYTFYTSEKNESTKNRSKVRPTNSFHPDMFRFWKSTFQDCVKCILFYHYFTHLRKTSPPKTNPKVRPIIIDRNRPKISCYRHLASVFSIRGKRQFERNDKVACDYLLYHGTITACIF